tara:strand:- start:968 stop:1123 length:156 start_codon:yes stop_codon:yes gene_type:complete
MKNINIIIWIIWFFLVIIWNYGYPAASPFLDVLVAVLLSLLNLLLIKLIKK